jgi:DNA-binding response OmpR family regulator
MPSRSENILVVDDEQNIRLLLRSALETDGFTVSEAAGVEEAIDSIEQRMQELILLDLWMPGSDGMTVLEYLNQKPPEERPRVIVLTANSRVPVVVKAMRLGASDFLEKPTTPEDLRISVASALEESAETEPRIQIQQIVRDDEKLGPALARVHQAIWNQDIHFTEYLLSALFRKAWEDPTWFNLLGAAFESEGNRGAAKTFYQKALNAPAGCYAAARNLSRLETPGADPANAEVDLGDQEKFLTEMIAEHESHHSESVHSIRSHS